MLTTTRSYNALFVYLLLLCFAVQLGGDILRDVYLEIAYTARVMNSQNWLQQDQHHHDQMVAAVHLEELAASEDEFPQQDEAIAPIQPTWYNNVAPITPLASFQQQVYPFAYAEFFPSVALQLSYPPPQQA